MDRKKLIEETKLAFEILYMSVAMAKQRLNGEDFIKVGIDIMREAKRNNVFDTHKELIASTLVDEFDKKLNPKMDAEQRQSMIMVLTGKSILFRI